MRNWRKSTKSYSNGACVEVASTPGTVAVRDTTDSDGAWLSFSGVSWGRFLATLK
jgi:Domain of unknown function (DUF397)